MPKKIDPQLWETYFKHRDSMSSNEAARRSGINKTTAWRLENIPNYNSSGRAALEAWRARNPGSITDKQRLNTQAKRALNDFAYFRLRYFGRKSTPWQVYAANLVREAHEEAVATMERKFIVINCPPGSGKSTTFTHDLPLWLLCRDRATRVLIGSATENLAGTYTEQIMTTLERQSPPPLADHQRRRGAVEAQACLVEDFGRFKPENGRNWRSKSFRISQPGDVEATTKESSVTAFGRDSSYLGQRPDIALWDDLVTEETTGTQDARDKTLRKWQAEAENRVEPGGVLILIGQRIRADDLYRYCIDLEDDDDEETAEPRRKYTHILFKAHYDEHCKGDHGKDARPYDPADPDNSGCLLDPVGISWKFLRQIQRADAQYGTSTYRIVYQQEDGDPARALVKQIWVDGGEDRETGERYVGCWDDTRVAGVVPPLEGEVTSVLSVDSSPSKFWGIGWWLIHPVSKRRILVDLHRGKMRTPDALAFNPDSGMFTGLFEEWWRSSVEQGRPITRLIFEANDSEVFFLDGLELTRWRQARGVLVTRHKTNRNKWDPNYGLESLAPVYMHGQVRLPGDVPSGSRALAQQLVREATNWPQGTSDLLMEQWFVEANMANLAVEHNPLPAQRRPSWVGHLPDGRNLRLVGAR